MIALGRSLIASMNGRDFPVVRRQAGSYIDGKFVPGPLVLNVTVFACEQPLSGDEIARIPEGDRDRERRKLYSADELRISKKGIYQADLVEMDGAKWQVENAEKWPNYWKVVVVRKDDKDEVIAPANPIVQSAALLADGKTLRITIQTEKSFTLPAQEPEGFTVTVDSTPVTYQSARRALPKVMELVLTTPVTSTQAVAVSYTPGNVTDAAGTPVAQTTTPIVADNGSEAT